MTREQLLAAEIYGYSFANYQDHLGIGNIRYEQLMPEAAMTLEQAAKENWPTSRIVEVLDVDLDEAKQLTTAFDRARQIVDAENPAELFRNAVRFSIQGALGEGLRDAESIEHPERFPLVSRGRSNKAMPPPRSALKPRRVPSARKKRSPRRG